MRELARPGTDMTGVITTSQPHIYREHEMTVSVISKLVTKVTFRNVPMSIPDEEILHLCSLYGELVDGVVHREVIRLGGATRHSITSSTRFVERPLTPGKSFKNFYWMVGPGAGDTGRRITVLHSNQPKHCSWCITPSQTLTVRGNGKTCESVGTPRACSELKDICHYVTFI